MLVKTNVLDVSKIII